MSISLLTLLTSCATSTPADKAGQQHKSISPAPLKYLDHPLANKIWDVKQQQFIDKEALSAQALSAKYVLLGETHDNSEHHKNQAWVLDLLKSKNGKVGVAFEMINSVQFKNILDKKPINTKELIAVISQEKIGWEYERYYSGVFDSTLKAGFDIYPANLSRPELMAIMSKGKQNIPEYLKKQIKASPLPEEQKAAMKEEIKKSHCGMINTQMSDAMLLGQKVRDAEMSHRLTNHNSGAEATMALIAGSGHVRKDRGVPHYMQATIDKSEIISIAWLEITPEFQKIEDYAKYWGDGKLPFDIVWFTPMATRTDPCEEMKKYMDKHKNKHKDQQPNQQDEERPTPRQRVVHLKLNS